MRTTVAGKRKPNEAQADMYIFFELRELSRIVQPYPSTLARTVAMEGDFSGRLVRKRQVLIGRVLRNLKSIWKCTALIAA
jgi:hypothetical protein